MIAQERKFQNRSGERHGYRLKGNDLSGATAFDRERGCLVRMGREQIHKSLQPEQLNSIGFYQTITGYEPCFLSRRVGRNGMDDELLSGFDSDCAYRIPG
ncbi:MAG: hypothetical protein BWY82_02813 [Verrucomicrobia bacterium ADurb.Bin474]|nr:MAG: hypothetical protein BWY82_02813 [Verrucomicrobia bacterium ADurb.Bin474]